MYSRSTDEVSSNKVTSSLLRKWTRLPTDAYEVGALTLEVTDNYGSNGVLPCGAYGPWTHLPQITQLCGLWCVEETTARLVSRDNFLPIPQWQCNFLISIRTKEVSCNYENIDDCKKRNMPKVVQRLQPELSVSSYLVNCPDWVKKKHD